MDKPTTGTEIKHDGLRALLLESLDLSERNLDDLYGLSLHPDSFVSLLPDGLFVRPVPQAPPPHHSYIQVCDHFFIPRSILREKVIYVQAGRFITMRAQVPK